MAIASSNSGAIVHGATHEKNALKLIAREKLKSPTERRDATFGFDVNTRNTKKSEVLHPPLIIQCKILPRRRLRPFKKTKFTLRFAAGCGVQEGVL